MKHFSKFLVGASLAAMTTASAFAADLPSRKAPPPYIPPPPVFTWTGFYVGLNAGAMFNAYNNNNNNFYGFGNSQSNNKVGFIGGGQVGYNWQFNGPILLGLEADFNGHSSISSNNNFAGFGGGNSGSGFLGTVRGRLGFLATPTFLIYATGGLAYGNQWSAANSSIALFAPGVVPFFGYNNNQSNGVKAGWTAGGGLEWMFSPNWSVKAEYLYVDLGKGPSNFLLNYGNASKSTAHVARLGVNYHFNWGAPAPVVARY